MAGKSRKVSFYLLVLEKKESIQGSRHKRFVPLKNDEIEEHFRSIYDNKMQSLSNGNKAISVNFSSGTDIVEVLDYTNHCAFVKIGQQNPSNTVALRDQETLETEEVPMAENQLWNCSHIVSSILKLELSAISVLVVLREYRQFEHFSIIISFTQKV